MTTVIVFSQPLTSSGKVFTPSPFGWEKPASVAHHVYCDGCTQVWCFDTRDDAEGYRHEHVCGTEPTPKPRPKPAPARGATRWTPAELDALEVATTLEEAIEMLPCRTESAIRNQATKRRLGLITKPLPRWTAEEERILAGTRSIEEARRKLPHRSRSSLREKARRTSPGWDSKRTSWTETDLDVLRSFTSSAAAAAKLGRTQNACRRMANKIGHTWGQVTP